MTFAKALQGNSAYQKKYRMKRSIFGMQDEVAPQPAITALSQVFWAQTNWSKFLAGMHSVDLAKFPLPKLCEQLHLFRKIKSSIACRQVLQEHAVLHAKGDKNEVGALQKQDRFSCVSLWNVVLQSWKTRSSRLKCCQTLRNKIETRSSKADRTKFGSEDIEWCLLCWYGAALSPNRLELSRPLPAMVLTFAWLCKRAAAMQGSAARTTLSQARCSTQCAWDQCLRSAWGQNFNHTAFSVSFSTRYHWLLFRKSLGPHRPNQLTHPKSQDASDRMMACTMFGCPSAVPSRSEVSTNNLDCEGHGQFEQRQGSFGRLWNTWQRDAKGRVFARDIRHHLEVLFWFWGQPSQMFHPPVLEISVRPNFQSHGLLCFFQRSTTTLSQVPQRTNKLK